MIWMTGLMLACRPSSRPIFRITSALDVKFITDAAHAIHRKACDRRSLARRLGWSKLFGKCRVPEVPWVQHLR